MTTLTPTGAPPPAQALPLPAAGWGAADALAALEQARPQLPLDLPATLAVVSDLTTVVLRCGAWAVKVYPPGTDLSHLQQLTAALTGSGTAHLPAYGPLPTDHGVLTLTPWIPAAAPLTWPELGSLLRAFHAEHAAAVVPAWTPLSRLPGQVAGLPEPCGEVLLRARNALLNALDEAGSVLGHGPIHGDVSLLNPMRTPAGPRLIDLDWVACAPREYDLASAARRVRSGELSGADYGAFCDAYGFDVRAWDGLPILDRIAELGGVAFRLWDCRHHGRDLDWVPAEARRWRHPL